MVKPNIAQYVEQLAIKEHLLDVARKQFDEGGWASVTALTGNGESEKLKSMQDLLTEVKGLREDYDRAKEVEQMLEDLKKPRDPVSPETIEDVGATLKHGDGPKNMEKLIRKISAADEAIRMGGLTADVTLKTLFTSAAGWDPIDLFSGLVVPEALEPISIVQHIPSVPTDQQNVIWMEQTTVTNAAAPRAQGASLGESAIAYTKRTTPVESIGTFLPIVDEILDDVPMLAQMIMSDMRWMVMDNVDDNIINGNGTSPNPQGLANLTGIQTQAKGTDDTFTAIRKLMTKIRAVGKARPSLIVIHPSDMEALATAREAGAASLSAHDSDTVNVYNAGFLWGNPIQGDASLIWGVPYVESTQLTANTLYMGDFARFSLIRDRQQFIVEQGYTADDFTKLQKTLRAYVRLAILFTRASAFGSVTGV